MRVRTLGLEAWLALFAVAGLSECFGQTPQGAIAGTVFDQSWARLAGATIIVESRETGLKRTASSDSVGEFRATAIPPGRYRVTFAAPGFAQETYDIDVSASSTPTISAMMKPQIPGQTVSVEAKEASLAWQPIETTSSVEKTTISAQDLARIPLAHRSFANIAYMSPMTLPVEPSDPTKARITAVSFGGSSGLNVDLSVDGGDDNDDYIGGFLQNYSPDVIQSFAVRTASFDADTSRTNGGSIVIATRSGTDRWHGDLAGYFREKGLNARNELDNPAPNPKQPFSRQNLVGTIGGPLVRGRAWFFSSLEYTREDASVAYSALSLNEFNALAQLATQGLIPGVSAIDVPTSVATPYRDTLFSSRVDWAQSARSQWFFRGSLDRNHTKNDLVQQATLPSTGAYTRSDYFSFLLNQQCEFDPAWLGCLSIQAGEFHHTKERNSNLGLALAFPFSSNYHTTSGFETFGDNQFVTPITAFPIERDQQKYQFRYDLHHSATRHSLAFGVNVIHEPVLRGELASNSEQLVQFPYDPSYYVAHPDQFPADFVAGTTDTGGGSGRFAQSIRRFGVYAQDSWRALPGLAVNVGLRYDTTFGLFVAEGREQDRNPALITLKTLGIALIPGIPHDYRGAISPRLGLAYSPGQSATTVFRAGAGIYYNDLTQNGWVDAFRSVNAASTGLLGPADQGAVIDPAYKTPYALEFSAGVEHAFASTWHLNVFYEHHQGVHQYRRYEYVSGITLPAEAPSISVFRTDNRSRYDGISLMMRHSMSRHFELTAHYTLAGASTWGATVGELFDYVNGVSDVRNAFGPGDHGPSGEDVRHRFVLAGVLRLPFGIEASTLSQFESARPFTLSTPADVNGDGLDSNDRAVVNGRQTALDQFRGTPFAQVDLRISRELKMKERVSCRLFVEFFNLFNRQNPGNNYVGTLAALPVPPSQLANATDICTDAACTSMRPITSLNDLRVPAGALGDFFGPGTTVGIPFAAQFGLRVSF